MKIIPPKLFRFRTIKKHFLSTFDKDLIFFFCAKDFNDPYDTLITSSSFEVIRQCTTENLYPIMTDVREQLLKGVKIPSEIKSAFHQNVLDQMLNLSGTQAEEIKTSKTPIQV